jgi:Domain of unknown function (DUF4282)
MPGETGFLTAVFDFSFTESVTTRVARGLYGLAMAMGGLLAVLLVTLGLAQSLFLGVLSLVVAGVGFLLFVAVVRLWLEAAVVRFRIAERTEEIAEEVAGIAVNTAGWPPSG